MNQDTTEDYEVLVQRLLDEVDLTEPVRLRKAREARSTAPESWSTGIELAQALHRAGHPHHAMGIWSEALDLQPHNSEALSGWLETQLAYELGQREESAEIALMRSPLDVPVVLLAAEILVEYGRKGEIHQVMNKALSGNPGNESIVEAMEKWGIEIEEFSPE
jgi:hypothetical protein